jgi:hypothetical protein
MRRIAIASLALAAAVAAPAQAHNAPPQAQNGKSHDTKSQKCKPHAVGFNAYGTLESQTLTQTKGADTPRRSDDRYSGTVTVTVKRANHGAPTGTQTYTLDNARVKFYDANKDGSADQPKPGDRVKVHGKITKLAKKCDSSGFTPTTTVRSVHFKPAKS